MNTLLNVQDKTKASLQSKLDLEEICNSPTCILHEMANYRFKSFDCLIKQLHVTITLIIEYIINSIIYLCFISLLVTLSIEDILHTDIQNRELKDVNEESSEEEESNEFDESNDGDESNEEDEHCNDSEK